MVRLLKYFSIFRNFYTKAIPRHEAHRSSHTVRKGESVPFPSPPSPALRILDRVAAECSIPVCSSRSAPLAMSEKKFGFTKTQPRGGAAWRRAAAPKVLRDCIILLRIYRDAQPKRVSIRQNNMRGGFLPYTLSISLQRVVCFALHVRNQLRKDCVSGGSGAQSVQVGMCFLSMRSTWVRRLV